jgi:hypothetical protein
MARLEQLTSDRGLSDKIVEPLRVRHTDRLRRNKYQSDGEHLELTEAHDEIEFLLIAAERDHINQLFREGKLKDETRRRIERELDLREADLRNQRMEE